MERVLVISPHAGLGNRVRSLCSALVLGEVLGRKVYHTWYDEPITSTIPRIQQLQRVGFSSLFQELIPRWTGGQVDTCYTEWMFGDYWYDSQSSGQQRFAKDIVPYAIGTDASVLLSNVLSVILLETTLIVQIPDVPDWSERMTVMYCRYFHPLSRYMERVPSLDIGVSVRRGDLLSYYPSADQDLLAVAAWLVPRLQGKKAIILSDDIQVRKRLRIVLNCSCELDTNELEDWERGFVEFLTLSKCTTVYGTPCSSFAEEAASFGGVVYMMLGVV